MIPLIVTSIHSEKRAEWQKYHNYKKRGNRSSSILCRLNLHDATLSRTIIDKISGLQKVETKIDCCQNEWKLLSKHRFWPCINCRQHPNCSPIIALLGSDNSSIASITIWSNPVMRTEYDFLHIIRRTSDDHFIHQATSWHFVTCWFPQWWPDQGPRGLCNWNMSKIYKFIQIAGRKNIHPKTFEHQHADKPQWPHLALGFCSELLFNLPQRLLVRCRREPCLDTIFFVFRHQHSAWWATICRRVDVLWF